MSRFYFDWELRGVVERDQRGMTLPNLEAAIEVATDCNLRATLYGAD
jgi:hypothetical protein